MPGATTSGLMRPSLVGPRLLNAAICSALPALGSSLSGFAVIALGPRRAVREDRVLPALRGARGVGQRRIAVPMRLAIVLARADGDHVLRGAGRVDRHLVDDAVGVRIDAGVAGRERHGQIAMRPENASALALSARIRAGHFRAPRIRMHARVLQIRLVEEVADIVGNADQVIAIGHAVEQAAQQRRHRVVFDRLEHEVRLRRGAAADAARVAGAERRGRHVRAVPGVHILRAVVDDGLETEIRRRRAS